MKIISRILLVALALLVVSELLPGVIVDDVFTAIGAAFVLSLLNAIVRPVLVILTLPITVVTLGVFILVVNALLFWTAAGFFSGVTVTDFWNALLGSVIISIVSVFGNRFL